MFKTSLRKKLHGIKSTQYSHDMVVFIRPGPTGNLRKKSQEIRSFKYGPDFFYFINLFEVD